MRSTSPGEVNFAWTGYLKNGVSYNVPLGVKQLYQKYHPISTTLIHTTSIKIRHFIMNIFAHAIVASSGNLPDKSYPEI